MFCFLCLGCGFDLLVVFACFCLLRTVCCWFGWMCLRLMLCWLFWLAALVFCVCWFRALLVFRVEFLFYGLALLLVCLANFGIFVALCILVFGV